jgi:hypothetical protein
MTLNRTIEQLEKDFITYRNKCVFKIQEEKDSYYRIDKKCLMCNGLSSVSECEDFIDIPHLIHFYKYNNLNKFDNEGYYL